MKKSTFNVILNEFQDYLEKEDKCLLQTYQKECHILKRGEEQTNLNKIGSDVINHNIGQYFECQPIEPTHLIEFLEKRKIHQLISKEDLLSFIHIKRIKDDNYYSWNRKNNLTIYQNVAVEYLAKISEDYLVDYIIRPMFITSNIDAFNYILNSFVVSQSLKDKVCDTIMSQHKLKFADYQTKAFQVIEKHASNPKKHYDKFTFVKPQTSIDENLFKSQQETVLCITLSHDTLNSYNVNKTYTFKELVQGINHACFALNDYLDLLKINHIDLIQSKEETKAIFYATILNQVLIENMLNAHLRAFLKEDEYHNGLKKLNLDKEVIEKITLEHSLEKNLEANQRKKNKL